jgi:hypothetical protein
MHASGQDNRTCPPTASGGLTRWRFPHNHALHTGSASLSTIRSGGRLTREHGMGLIVARAPVPAQSAAGELALASGGGVVSGIVKGGRIPSRGPGPGADSDGEGAEFGGAGAGVVAGGVPASRCGVRPATDWVEGRIHRLHRDSLHPRPRARSARLQPTAPAWSPPCPGAADLPASTPHTCRRAIAPAL